MVWQQYVLGAWLAFGTLCTIWYIGRPRGPITPGVAVTSVVFTGIFLWLLATIPVDA